MTDENEALRAQFEAWATAAYRLSFDDDTPLKRYLWAAYQAGHAAAKADDVGLPPLYMLAKLQMVMPLLQEARDALTALREDQRVRHGISKSLADRMDAAGTFSLYDWKDAIRAGAKEPSDEA